MLVTLLCLSLAATGLVIAFVQHSAQSRPMAEFGAANPKTAESFYAELQKVLRGEPGANLDGMVTADFVDHEVGADTGRSASDLVAQLSAFGEFFPGTRLEVSGIRPDGNNLIVQVRAVVPQPGSIAGVTLAVPSPGTGIEILRVRRGSVSERWSLPMPGVAATTFPLASRTMVDRSQYAARLFRIELPPGAEVSWTADDVTAIMAVSGTLTVRKDWADELDRPVTETTEMSAGQAESIPSSTSLQLRSHDSAGSTLLVFTAHKVSLSAAIHFTHEGGASSTWLWNSDYPLRLYGQWRLQIGRVELDGHLPVGLGELDGKYVLVETEDASVGISTTDGSIRRLDATYELELITSPSLLLPGRALQVSGANSMDLEPRAGAAVWLIVITPTDFDGRPPTPTPPPGRPGSSR